MGSQQLSADQGGGDPAPLPAPIPGAEFKRLTRRQSIVAWVLGSVAGIGIAVAALLICALI